MKDTNIQARWLLAAVLILRMTSSAEGAEPKNPTNNRLLALPPERQAQMLGNSLRKDCVGQAAFAMGVTATGRSRGYAYWSVRCKNGKSYVIQIAPDAKGTAIAADCSALQGTGRECFKKF